jgi:hypothetical protein
MSCVESVRASFGIVAKVDPEMIYEVNCAALVDTGENGHSWRSSEMNFRYRRVSMALTTTRFPPCTGSTRTSTSVNWLGRAYRVGKSGNTQVRQRVRSGLAAARARGQRLGRPPIFLPEARIDQLRANGQSWRAIAKELGMGMGTIYRVAQRRSKNLCGPIPQDGVEVLHG